MPRSGFTSVTPDHNPDRARLDGVLRAARIRCAASSAAVPPQERACAPPLSINITLDGCCDHLGITPDEELYRHATQGIARADALLFGRVIYQMMEEAWAPVARTVVRPSSGPSRSRETGCSWAGCSCRWPCRAGLIDEYEFIVHPRIAGRGPALFADCRNTSTFSP